MGGVRGSWAFYFAFEMFEKYPVEAGSIRTVYPKSRNGLCGFGWETRYLEKRTKKLE